MKKEVENRLAETSTKTVKKSEWKKNIKIVVSMLLVAVISIAGTLAFLQDQTGKKVNTFTGSPGIDLKLTEPSYDEDKAGSYTPEMVIPKDPTLTNSSTAADAECEEWVAIRVDYTFGDGTNATAVTRTWLETYVIEELNISTDLWYKLPTKAGKADTNYDIYLYKNKLAKGASATLFTQVKIKDQTRLENTNYGTNEDKKYVYANGKYTNFEITVCGAAIKNDKTLSLTAITENDISTPINMNDLSNAVTTTSKDSQKVAVALATLLQNPATIELNKDGTIKTNS